MAISITWLAIVVLVLLATVCFRCLANGKIAPLLVLVLIAVVILTSGYFHRVWKEQGFRVAKTEAAEQAESLAALQADQPEGKLHDDHAPELDALWDKLTASRISLEESSIPEGAAPAADPEDKALRRALRDTVGLGEEGALPPAWVTTPPKQVGTIYRQSISSDRFVTREECRRQLETVQLPDAVCRRIEQVVAPQLGHEVTVSDPLPLGIGLDYIFREICRDQFTGTVDTSVGDMQVTHVLLEFNQHVDDHLREAWFRYERSRRIAGIGEIAVGVLAVLALVYGLLRVDTWTRGYYSQQLLWGGIAVIIVAGVMLLG